MTLGLHQGHQFDCRAQCQASCSVREGTQALHMEALPPARKIPHDPKVLPHAQA